MSKWISIYDKKPSEHKDYLCYHIESGIAQLGYRTHGDEYFFIDSECQVVPDVSHWMPLPKPPKPIIKNQNPVKVLDKDFMIDQGPIYIAGTPKSLIEN